MSQSTELNRIVQLTPPGRGAVATLLVEGPDAARAAGELLFTMSGKAWREVLVGQAEGHWQDASATRPVLAKFGGSDGEEVIVRRFGGATAGLSSSAELAPKTGTAGQASSGTRLELHCHGGAAAIRAIIEAFVERGFLAVSWKDWATSGAEDSFIADARIALAEARTERTAAILLDQYQGALSAAFGKIERGIGFQPVEIQDREKRQVGNLSHIESLLKLAPLGLHLTAPWRVVLAGEPNVGKSSLLNALLGYSRAIVHHSPGTTRDAVTGQTAFDGWPVELCDTAGLRDTDSEIEQAGVELARRQIDEADLTLLIFDAGKPWSADDRDLTERYPRAIVVHNKSDLPGEENRPWGIFVSAKSGDGIDVLIRMIVRRLVPEVPAPGAAVPFLEKHVEKLKELERQISTKSH
jgi:tRNA modification GTPase